MMIEICVLNILQYELPKRPTSYFDLVMLCPRANP